MNERTNITDQGYSYGGKDYVYETRTNPVTNTPYQVAIESTAPTSTIQTSTAQRKEDISTMQKFDTMAATKGISTPNAVATNPNAPTPEKTPSDATPVEKVPATVAQPWDINKDDTPEAQAAKSAAKASIDALDKQVAEVNSTFDALKANAPAENQAVMDQIKAKFNKTRERMMLNQANLLGQHEKLGYSTGGNRYTQMQEAGILSNDANNNLIQLSELDSQEATAIMEAANARKKSDFDMLSTKLTQLDKINDNRTTILKNLNDYATTALKNATTLSKIAETENLQGFSDVGKKAQALAPLYLEQIKNMDAKQMEAFINQKAKDNGIKPDILKSAIISEKDAVTLDEAKLAKLKTPVKTTTPKTTKKTATQSKIDDVSSIIKDFQTQIKSRGWKGANPIAYKKYKDQLLAMYGISAVTELDKQMASLGIKVDNGK